MKSADDVDLQRTGLLEEGNKIKLHENLVDQTCIQFNRQIQSAREKSDTLESKTAEVTSCNESGSEQKLLPEQLYIALECCLDDQCAVVRRAASIALYVLRRPVAKVTEITIEHCTN